MKKKETIRSLWTPTARLLCGFRRVAMLLLTTLLLTMTALTARAVTVDLSTVTADKVLQDGDVVTGILDTEHYPVKISIADGATVTLNGVTINGIHDDSKYEWAGISCEGDATIILADGTTNTVKGFRKYWPAIHVPQGKTLTIQGNGALEASNNGEAAGIGCGFGGGRSCGNICIKGGIITAIGSKDGTGIGAIGKTANCGNITIEKGVTYLKATNGPDATNGIGASDADHTYRCGKVTIFDIETGSISGEYTYDSSINYTVKFDNNGGTGSMNDLSLTLGEPTILQKHTFTRTNYLFAGWSTTANGDVEYLDEQMVMSLATTNNAIVTLYAVWKEPSETITPSSGAVRLLDGQTLSGQGGENTHVTIADGATVTLSGVNITSITNDTNHKWAGITCEGDATIILEENSTNAVKGGYDRPGIYVPTGKTLTIQGSGALESTGVGHAAGIGAGYKYPCGNIVIKGGSITATAQSGQYGAGIGGTDQGDCGDITIEDGVTYVKATKSGGCQNIGARNSDACGKVTVLGFEGPVTESPYIIDKSKKYTIQFYSNGGTGSMPVFSLILGQKIFLPKHTFTRTNYYFAGWSTTAAGDVEYLDEQAVMNLATTNNAIVTLYAVWKEPNEVITSSSGTVRLLDGQTLSGQGGENTHVTIADGATVTLNGVTITSITNDADHSWAGVTCEGDATIILAKNTTNAVTGGNNGPGIFVPEGKTLTIQGSGALEATGVGNAAGIGGSKQDNCGNIIIEGGNITATGGLESAGIGSGSLHSCGDITISGGTINTTGGQRGAGIGAANGDYSDQNSSCGNITISGGSITANGGKWAAGIGAGLWYSTCEDIFISTSGSVTATGGQYAAGIGTGEGRNEGTLSSKCGNITILSGNFVVTKGASANHSIGVGTNGTCGIVTIAGVEGYISTSPYTQNIVSDKYTVHFEANGGNGTMSDQSIYRGIETPLSRNTFANDGYAFIGWSTTVGGDVTYTDCYKVTDLAEKDGSITLYAKWMSTTGIPAGLQVDAEYTQSEDGFYYVKILTDELSTPATTTIVIDNPQYYTFKIYDNGGKNSDYSVTNQWESGLLTIKAPECYKVVLNGSADYHQADLTLYDDNTANNEKKIWGQILYLHGSIGTRSSTGRYLTIEFNPNYASYYGAGLDLTATIVPYTYTVRFNKNNDAATGTMEDQTHTWDATLALTANTFECTGYTFAGWATSADGDVVYNDAEEVSNIGYPEDASIELYAKWKKLMTNADISVIIPTQEWANSELTPEITVKDGETTLTLTTDYTVTPPSGTIQDAGDYIYTITGAGNYSGATTATFTITPKVEDNYDTWVLTVDQNGRKATFNGNYSGEDPIYTTEDIYVEEVEIVRTFPTSMGSDQYSTLMLPFDVNTVKLDGVSGIYTFNGVTDDGNGNLTVNVTKVWEDVDSEPLDLDAYKPYLVKMNAATLVINGGVTFKRTKDAVTNVVKDNWSLNGTLGYIQWLSTNDRKDEIGSVYGFAAGTNGSTISVGDFVKVKSGAFIYPLRAYLKYSPATSARGLKRGSETLPDRIPVVVRYDAPTGIAEMEREMSDGDAWFTIDGRRLSGEPTQHGIYIRQGRKHVIK